MSKPNPASLFFDEFDAIGKERGDLHETGEIKRLVTSLLLQLDDLPSYCVLVGATNHPELLDRATWRRFEIRLTLDRPDDEHMTTYFAERLREFDGPAGYTPKRLKRRYAAQLFGSRDPFSDDLHIAGLLAQGRDNIENI